MLEKRVSKNRLQRISQNVTRTFEARLMTKVSSGRNEEGELTFSTSGIPVEPSGSSTGKRHPTRKNLVFFDPRSFFRDVKRRVMLSGGPSRDPEDPQNHQLGLPRTSKITNSAPTWTPNVSTRQKRLSEGASRDPLGTPQITTLAPMCLPIAVCMCNSTRTAQRLAH